MMVKQNSLSCWTECVLNETHECGHGFSEEDKKCDPQLSLKLHFRHMCFVNANIQKGL